LALSIEPLLLALSVELLLLLEILLAVTVGLLRPLLETLLAIT
jgi:hypothetical protein